MKRVLKGLLIVSIFVCFFFFLKGTDIKASFNLIKQLGFYPVIILITTSLAYFSGALGWKYCIDSDTKPSSVRLFVIRHIGNTITLFNPASAIVGELFNAKMLINEGITEQDAYKSVLLSRSLMVLSQLVLFIIVLIWFIFFNTGKFFGNLLVPIYIGFVFLLLGVLGIIWLLVRKGKETEPYSKDKRWHKIIYQIKNMRFLLAEYTRKHPKKTVIAFVFFSMHWVLGSLELFFILYFLNYNVDIWDGLFLDTSIILLKSTVSFIPGQLGIEELINKFILQFVGILSPDLWLSVSILRRTRQLFWSGIALFFYMQIKRSERLIKNHGNIIRES